MSDNEIGKLPIRTELTVLPANKPTKLIGWVVKEYNGCEVYPYYPDANGQIQKEDLEPIRTEDGLKDGMQLMVPGILGGYHIMTVYRNKDGNPYAQNDNISTTYLEFGKDDRGCWTVGGLINLRGVTKAKLVSVEDEINNAKI